MPLLRLRYPLGRQRPRFSPSLAVILGLGLAWFAPTADAAGRSPTVVHQASAAVDRARLFQLPRGADFVALHWPRARGARLTVAFGRDAHHLRKRRAVLLDEVGEGARGREAYGQLVAVRGARVLRVTSSRALRRVTLVVLDDRGAAAPSRPVAAAATVAQPSVTPRIDWGADETLRYSNGTEIWPPAFYPVQKLIVHHTATTNADTDPAATIRSIYYYHAVTQGWGDIGYNFLIDESGRIYEGRHTFDYPSGSSPTAEDSSGNGVTAAHVQGYNSGTVGIALLGTLTDQDATPAARAALEKLLSWETDHHGIDPLGSSLYTNPVSGTQATFANIAGHRDLAATECPGGAFYATLPTIRSDVAALNGASPPAVSSPTAITGSASAITATSASIAGSVDAGGQETTYWFEYGTRRSYGASTPHGTIGASSGAVPVRADLAGLRSRTTYHYRLVAMNASGTSYGADATFKTPRSG